MLFLALASEGSGLCRLAGPGVEAGATPDREALVWAGGEPLAAHRGVSDASRRCKQRPSKFWPGQSKSFRLPFPLAESQLSRDISYGNKGHQD